MLSLVEAGAAQERKAAEGPPYDFYDYTLEDLALLFKERFDQPAFRARQLFQWVYKRGVSDLAQMSDLAKELRQKLEGVFLFNHLPILDRQQSVDGTRKYLLEVSQSGRIESVMIKQPKRMTLCVSSQVGCAMGCRFCRTATMGLKRNLRAAEIVRQILTVSEDSKQFDESFQNMVFMGMGEPLHNVKELTRALKIIKAEPGLNISGRRVTVSTSGFLPGLEKLAESKLEVNLAVSLNATDDEVRSEIMPVNRRFNLEQLLAALKKFPLKRRQRITIEYVMLAGVNDRAQDLKRLPKLLHGIPCKINLIPYNENAGLGYKTPSNEDLARWHDALLKTGIETTIRWSKGQDINAACGQLASKSAEVKDDGQAAKAQ